MGAALLGIFPHAQAAHALCTDNFVPAGAEGFAALALADALKKGPQQPLGLGVQVQAVGDGGFACIAAMNGNGQLGHAAGRQLGAAFIAGAFKALHGKQVIARRQQHKFPLFVGNFAVPVQGSIRHVVHIFSHGSKSPLY